MALVELAATAATVALVEQVVRAQRAVARAVLVVQSPLERAMAEQVALAARRPTVLALPRVAPVVPAEQR